MTLTLTAENSADASFSVVNDSTNNNEFEITGPTAAASAVTYPKISGKLNMNGFVGYKLGLQYKASGASDYTDITLGTLTTNVATATAGNATVTVTVPANIAQSTDTNTFYYNIAAADPRVQGELVAGTVQELLSSIEFAATSDDVNDLAGMEFKVTISFEAESVAGNGSLDNVKTIA